MKKCWICGNCYDRLSKEHIIPHYFGGSVSTENFSCKQCNQAMGRFEEKLNQVSVLMHQLDNAHGEPTTIIPIRGSRNKETKLSYGDNPSIQLSSSGHVQSDGWERPPGKNTSGDHLWIHTKIPFTLSKRDVHKSMLKAVMSLACLVGFPRGLLGAPLAYLAGNNRALDDMQPTDLGIPNRGMFARVWILAPPTRQIMSVYGAVVYGPVGNIYKLFASSTAVGPFCCELKAYSPKWQLHDEQADYMNWQSTTLEELAPRSQFDYVGRNGPFMVKRSRNSGLVALETSPSAVSLSGPSLYASVHPLHLTHGPANRFANWLRSTLSEETHDQFLADARELDAAYSPSDAMARQGDEDS